MIVNYYSIKDDVAGEFGPMFQAKNDGVAIRYAQYALKDVPEKTDYSLWCICQLDTESGQLTLPFDVYEVSSTSIVSLEDEE